MERSVKSIFEQITADSDDHPTTFNQLQRYPSINAVTAARAAGKITERTTRVMIKALRRTTVTRRMIDALYDTLSR